MEYLFSILFEWVFQHFVALVMSVTRNGFDALFQGFARQHEPQSKFMDLFSSCIAGVLFGVVTLLVIPMPVIRNVMIPGISLVLAPVLVGTTMFSWGKYRRGKGRTVSGLATFWGGALFAFSSALVRFAFLRLM
jgi:hypothetical protein